MTDENQGTPGEGGADDTSQIQGHLPGGDPPADEGGSTPSNEDRARAMGWAPRSEWRGADDRWVDAETFLDRAHNPSIAFERLEKVTNELAEVRAAREQDRAEFDRRITQLDKVNQVAMSRQRDQIVAHYEGLKRKAVEDADTERYDQLTEAEAQDLGELNKEVAEAVQQPGQGQGDGAGQPAAGGGDMPQVWRTALEQWMSKNTWFQSNPEMAQFARLQHVKLMQEAPGLTPEENLKKVREATMAEYPAAFGMPAKGNGRDAQGQGQGADQGGEPPAPDAEGGSRGSSGRRSNQRQTARHLPAEARSAGERFVKDGLFKDIEEYAKDYFAGIEEQAGRIAR